MNTTPTPQAHTDCERDASGRLIALTFEALRRSLPLGSTRD